jgi:hypothetical protein
LAIWTRPVVLLNLNPGFVEADQVTHLDPAFNAAAVANLRHGAKPYAFYLLDPANSSPGQDWWMRKLGALISESSLVAAADRVFVIELHGYHSRRYSASFRPRSQAYSRALVLRAIHRRAELVVMRGWRQWLELVPELAAAEQLTMVRSVQNPCITPRNLASFGRIVAAVNEGSSLRGDPGEMP